MDKLNNNNKENQCNLNINIGKGNQESDSKLKKKKFYQNKKKINKDKAFVAFKNQDTAPIENKVTSSTNAIQNKIRYPANPFHFKLTSKDFKIIEKNRIEQEKTKNSLIIDLETQSILDENSYRTDKMFEEHKIKVNLYYAEVKRLETQQWLDTRTADERAQYLERTKRYA